MATMKTADIRKALLERQGVNWTLTDEDIRAYDAAIDTALERLGRIAGKDRLCVNSADALDLVCSAAWYIRENRWPEFLESYRSDLLILRLREAFSCGKT